MKKDKKMKGEFRGYTGKTGFLKAFKKKKQGSSKVAKWEYKDHCIGFLHENSINKYSVKFHTIFKSLKNSVGTIFIYCEWIEGCALPLALLLEQNGYARFTHSKQKKGGQLLSKENLSGQFITIRRCYCGILENEHSSIKHKFKQGTYVYISGADSKVELDTLLREINNHEDNNSGEKIKIIIGTGVMKEGISLFRIREIHITSPWHHLNRLEQVIGRGTRTCSHWHLEKGERNITIFKHCATVPKFTKKNKKRRNR